MANYEPYMDDPAMGPGGTYERPTETPSWYLPAGLAAGALLGYGALRRIRGGIRRGVEKGTGSFRQGWHEATPQFQHRNWTIQQQHPKMIWRERGVDAAKKGVGL